MSEIVPKILVYGDMNEFLTKAKNIKYEICGYITYFDEISEKIVLNNQVYKLNDFKKYVDENQIDYLVFTDIKLGFDFNSFLNFNKINLLVRLHINCFINIVCEFYLDMNIRICLYDYLKDLNLNNVLDYDAYFLKIKSIVKFNNFMKLDGIIRLSLDREFLKLKNIYDGEIYEDFSYIKNKIYDIILMIDKSINEFKRDYDLVKNITNEIIIYTKSNSNLYNYITNNNFIIKKIFKTNKHTLFVLNIKKIVTNKTKSLNQFIKNNIINKNNNLTIYVVNYKNIKLTQLPDGYKELNVGNKNKYNYNIKTNTGDNINYLNPYLNELTALYWIWKNTNDYYVGLNHYRRFFSENYENNFSYDKIISKDKIIDLLQYNDIILPIEQFQMMIQYDVLEITCNKQLIKICYDIFYKKIKKYQPNYIDSFNFVFNNNQVYHCHLLITNRKIFNKYCEWLFSFIIDAGNEFLQKIKIDKLSFSDKRIMAYIGERMLIVWLVKQNLKIREMNWIINKNI